MKHARLTAEQREALSNYYRATGARFARENRLTILGLFIVAFSPFASWALFDSGVSWLFLSVPAAVALFVYMKGRYEMVHGELPLPDELKGVFDADDH